MRIHNSNKFNFPVKKKNKKNNLFVIVGILLEPYNKNTSY